MYFSDILMVILPSFCFCIYFPSPAQLEIPHLSRSLYQISCTLLFPSLLIIHHSSGPILLSWFLHLLQDVFMYVGVLSVCVLHAYSTHRCHKRASGPPELKLQMIATKWVLEIHLRSSEKQPKPLRHLSITVQLISKDSNCSEKLIFFFFLVRVFVYHFPSTYYQELPWSLLPLLGYLLSSDKHTFVN